MSSLMDKFRQAIEDDSKRVDKYFRDLDESLTQQKKLNLPDELSRDLRKQYEKSVEKVLGDFDLIHLDGKNFQKFDIQKLFDPLETAQAHNEKLLLAELGSPEEVKRVCDALVAAVKKGDMAGVASVLDAHPSAIGTRYQERSAWKELFYVALETSTPEVCRALIETYGVDPEARLNDRTYGATPLCYMIGQANDYNGGYDKVDLLVACITKKSGAAGLNVLSQGCPALHKAIRYSGLGGNTRIIERLLNAGASLDVPYSDFNYVAWMSDEKNRQHYPKVCAVIQEACIKKAEALCNQGTSSRVQTLGKMKIARPTMKGGV